MERVRRGSESAHTERSGSQGEKEVEASKVAGA
jgi:hypothetical protein